MWGEQLYALSSAILSFYASLGQQNPKVEWGRLYRKASVKTSKQKTKETNKKTTKTKISGKCCSTILTNSCFYLVCVFFIGLVGNYRHLFPIPSLWLLSTSDRKFGKPVDLFFSIESPIHLMQFPIWANVNSYLQSCVIP